MGLIFSRQAEYWPARPLRPKTDLFERLGKMCKDDAIIATNTSSFSVAEMVGTTLVLHPSTTLVLHPNQYPPPDALQQSRRVGGWSQGGWRSTAS